MSEDIQLKLDASMKAWAEQTVRLWGFTPVQAKKLSAGLVYARILQQQLPRPDQFTGEAAWFAGEINARLDYDAINARLDGTSVFLAQAEVEIESATPEEAADRRERLEIAVDDDDEETKHLDPRPFEALALRLLSGDSADMNVRAMKPEPPKKYNLTAYNRDVRKAKDRLYGTLRSELREGGGLGIHAADECLPAPDCAVRNI